MDTMDKVLFLDQDETLGQFLSSGMNFYPGVGEFLAKQKKSGADLYLASTGSEEVCERNMADFAEFFTGILVVNGLAWKGLTPYF